MSAVFLYLYLKLDTMDAKELRVGNYLERYNKVTGVKDIIRVGGDTPFLAFESMTTLQFNPVPLTEEWFLKFGFEFDTIDWQFPNNSVYFIGWYAGKWCLGTHSDGVLKETYFEYVHQLQNLYFALTGEELQLK